MNAKEPTSVRPGRNLHLYRGAFWSRHVGLVAERGLRDVDVEVVDQINALAFQRLMRGDANRDVQIAGRRAIHSGLALTGQSNLLTVVNPSWHSDEDAMGRPDPTGAAALLTGRQNNPPLAPTPIARAYRDKLADERLLDPTNLARSVTGGAAARLGSWLRADAATPPAPIPPCHFHPFFASTN